MVKVGRRAVEGIGFKIFTFYLSLMLKNRFTIALAIIVTTVGCADKSYPEDMTGAEREEYYRKFNESKTDEEWEAIRAQRKLEEKDNSANEAVENSDQRKGSISFSIKNNSIFSKRLRIDDNVLDFKPLGKRYFGFKPDTKVFLIQDGEADEYLFTITKGDRGKVFKIAE